MFKETKAFSGFSVDDISKAKTFYSQTLGLEVTEEEMGILVLHIAGGTEIIAYPKGDAHQPASFTILNFPVENIDEAVDKLAARGVQFEQYGGDIKTDKRASPVVLHQKMDRILPGSKIRPGTFCLFWKSKHINCQKILNRQTDK